MPRETRMAAPVSFIRWLSRLTISNGPFGDIYPLELNTDFAVWIQEQPILEAFT